MPTEKWNRSLLFEDLKQLDKWLFSKKTFISIFSIGLIIILKPLFEHLTNQYLVTKESSSSTMIDIMVIFIGIFMFSFGVYKFHLKYQPSYNHILIIILVVLAYSLFRFGDHSFSYDKFKWDILSNFYYLDFLVFASSFFPFVNGLRAKLISVKKYKNTESISTNTYFEDRPINQNQQNELLIKEISDAICSNEFLGSFSIGIMGTWGHGKSSFIQVLKQKLKSTPEAKGIIEINFSPFLNHKEEDVISDFFKSFSNQLSRYSGQLSQSLLEYAGSITKLYKRGEITDLLSNMSSANGNPAFELYNNVNDLIGKTNRKIVVYIDDLDRLSSKEILQIFKLIRNTSNFKNTFFILALDKTYVVNALAADKSFMESNFIDKFFQLEIFLPEINEVELATYLSDLLIKSKKFNADQISIILKPIREQETLFGSYIKNYRDCIRLTNQIIFDHSVLENLIVEVSIIDTLNLIFLRTRFPQIFNELHQNRRRFLIEDTRDGIYFLRKKKNEDQVNIGLIEDYTDFSDYKIDDLIVANKADYNFTFHERTLILKTLTALFAKHSATPDSIMHWRNYNKLMRLRHDRNDLMTNEFSNWFSSISLSNQDESTIKLLDHGKGGQLVDKISSYPINSKADFLNTVIGCFQLLKRNNQYNLDKLSLLSQLNTLLDEKNSEYITYRPSKTDRKKIINENYFENDTVLLDERIQLLSFIKDADSWGFDKEELSRIAVKYFNEYLSSNENKTWDISDYKCYRYYHELKDLTGPEILKKSFIEYLNRNDPTVFCSQNLDTAPFHWLYFGVSRFVVELFESYLKFGEFLESHPNKDLPHLKEYLKYYNLWSIANYKKYIKFIFKEFDVSNLNKQKSQTNIEKGISGIQMFVEFNNGESIEKAWHSLKPDEDKRFDQDITEYNDKFYAFYNSYDFISPLDFINYVFNRIGKDENSTFTKDIDEIALTAVISKDGIEIAKLYSIQYGEEISSDNNL